MAFHGRIFIGAMVAGTLLSCAGHASENTPGAVAGITTRTIKARVYLDKTIQADARLAADCSDEGRKWVNTRAAESAADLKNNPDRLKDKDRARWDLQRNYDARSIVGDRYVSIVRLDGMETSSAPHINYALDTILWDKAQNRRISIRPFFTETENDGPTMKAMQTALMVAVKAAIEKDGGGANEMWLSDIKPGLPGIGAVTLAPSTIPGKSSGLTFHYPPYHPLFLTGHVAFVPWKTLETYLSPEGIRIFGGERPKSDEDQSDKDDSQ